MKTKHYSFKTERLYIRPVSTDDAPFILELMNSPKWIKYIGDRNINTIEEAKNYITDKALSQLKTHGHTNNLVIRKADNTKLGTCGIYHREGTELPDIGFAFLPNYEGKGYAFEAMQQIMQFAQVNLKLKSVRAFTMEDNTSSKKLLYRLGLELVGLRKFPGGEEELLMYQKDFA